MIKNSAIKLPLTFAITALLGACGGGGSSSSSSATTASFTLGITDGPVDGAQEVVIQFDGVSIKPAEADELTFVFDSPRSIDLLTLQGTMSATLLSDVDIPAGEYNWIRLDISAEEDSIYDSYIILEDGSQHELRVPSGSQSGLKLVKGFTTAAGGNYDFTVDFDLRKSVTNPPGQSSVILKPVLRLVNNIETGSLSGSIDANLLATACPNVTENDGAVYVYEGSVTEPADIAGSDSDPLTSALVDSFWNYEVGFLLAGDYTAAYTCDNEQDDPEAEDSLTFYDVTEFSITANTETIVDFD